MMKMLFVVFMNFLNVGKSLTSSATFFFPPFVYSATSLCDLAAEHKSCRIRPAKSVRNYIISGKNISVCNINVFQLDFEPTFLAKVRNRRFSNSG